MPAFKFDRELIPKVLGHQGFRTTGIYAGSRLPHHYVVIDPRRRNVSVWTKPNDDEFDVFQHQAYMDSAKANGSVFSTNGAPMQPAPFTGSSMMTGSALTIAGFAASTASGVPWNAYDTVRSGGSELDAGVGFVKYKVERNGQGSFENYSISRGTPSGVEGMPGYGLVEDGAVIDSSDHTGLKQKKGATVWCRRPLGNALSTDQWETTVPWFPEALNQDGGPKTLTGLIIGVAVRAKPVTIASDIVEVGCTEAVAMDGSTSTVCFVKGKRKITCDKKKGVVQRWGLYCS